MTKLADHLDKVVQKHDRYAYFEQESGGIMTAVFESAQKNEAIGPEDTVTHAKQMEFKKQYVAKRKPKVNMSSFYFDGPFAVDDNTGTNISGAKLGMKCKDLEVALDKFFLEDAEGMKALKKLTKENKFIVYCDGHAKYCKTRQEAEAHAKAIKAGQVKDLLGRTIKPTEPVKIEEIHESAQKNESAYISFQECKTLYKLLGKFEKVILNEYPGPSNYKREFLDEVDSIKTLLKDMWDGQKLESAQINESRNWKVAVELSAPDNMNNAYVEDTVEHFLDKAGLTVFDVTATRK